MTSRKFNRNQQDIRNRRQDWEEEEEQRYAPPRLPNRNYNNNQLQSSRGNPRKHLEADFASDLKSILQPRKDKVNKKIDYKAGTNEQQISSKTYTPSSNLYSRENCEKKQYLDSQLEDYLKRGPREGERRAIAGQRRVREQQSRARERQIQKRESEKPRQQRRQQVVLEGSDDDSEDWLVQKDDKEDKQTSETNLRQEKYAHNEDFSDSFPTLPKPQQTKPRGQQWVVRKKQEVKESDQPRVKRMEIMNILESVVDSQSQPSSSEQINEIKTQMKIESRWLTNMIDNSALLEQEAPAQSHNKLEEEAVPAQKIKSSILEMSKQQKKWVSLRFVAEENVLEFKVKEIQLVELGVTARIGSNDSLSIKKCPSITVEDIRNYIEILTSGHSFPRIMQALPQTVHKPVEGEDENIMPIANVADFRLCKISSSRAPSKGGEVDRALVVLRVVSVRCMCGAKNQILVIQDNSSVACSCRKCSSRMLGKITEVKIDDR